MFDKIRGRKRDLIVPIDPELLSPESRELEKGLLKRVVGQDKAVRQLVHIYQTFRTGLQAPNKPLGILLFLGPTGVGKTRVVEALAEELFGRRDAMIKIDCGEYSHDHEIAKLIGSPPGYLGHGKTQPRLTQAALEKFHRRDLKLSILLLDEIEKASEDFYQLLLGILGAATLTLGDNTTVDFTNTLIIMTSNEGSSVLQKIIAGNDMGFTSNIATDEEKAALVLEEAHKALTKKFSPEFLNRVDHSIVFDRLNADSLRKITHIELEGIQDRILSAGHFILLGVEDAAEDYILKEGTSEIYGARELNRALTRLLVEPISNLIATKQINTRDMLVADYKSGKTLTFTKKEGVVDPPPPVLPGE